MRRRLLIGVGMLVCGLAASSCGPSPSSRSAGSRPSRPPLPARLVPLYQYVRHQQIAADADPRYDGGWPVSTRLAGLLPLRKRESDVFLPLHLLLMLERVAERYELPGESLLEAHFLPMMMAYLADARRSAEPAGSVGFWALYRAPGGGLVHAPERPVLPALLARLTDIPNDTDTASQAFLWLSAAAAEGDFRADYLAMLGDWTDTGRGRQAAADDRWKAPDSGAFLTWTEPDRAVAPQSRIPRGINDVDCVVNLNILHSLALAGAVPQATALGADAACTLVRQAAAAGDGGHCSSYYDEAQFYLAYGRALAAGVSCLEPARAAAAARAIALAARPAAGDQAPQAAEILLALKLLAPPPRAPAVTALVSRLASELLDDAEVQADGTEALLGPTLFRGTFALGRLPGTATALWSSAAVATATGIAAMTEE